MLLDFSQKLHPLEVFSNLVSAEIRFVLALKSTLIVSSFFSTFVKSFPFTVIFTVISTRFSFQVVMSIFPYLFSIFTVAFLITAYSFLIVVVFQCFGFMFMLAKLTNGIKRNNKSVFLYIAFIIVCFKVFYFVNL